MLNKLPVVMFAIHMLGMIFKKFKILYSVIISNTINMMRYFFWFKIASDMLFHYKMASAHIISFSGRMFGFIYLNISSAINKFAAFPLWIFITFKHSFASNRHFSYSCFRKTILFSFIPRYTTFLTIGHFYFGFFRRMCAFVRFRQISFMGFAKFFSFTPRLPFRFSSIINSCWHNFLLEFKNTAYVSICIIAFLLININSKLCFANDILPLSAHISLSLRTANIPDQPTDYQYAGGYKTETSEVSGYRERENGIKYNGFDYKKNARFFYSTIMYKESQQIDTQAFAIKYPIKNWGIGAGLNSQKWNHGQAMIMIQYSDGIVDIAYQLANNRQIIDSKVSEQIPLKGNFYIEPLALYHYEIVESVKKTYWQAKILIGYKFDIKE